MKEVRDVVVEACNNVLLNYAKNKQIENDKVNIRIDLQSMKDKPVLAVFNESKFIEPCTIKDIIHAGGGIGLSMFLGGTIRNIIKDIFSQTLKQLESKESKDLFLLLYLKVADGYFEPMLAIYFKKEFITALPVSEAITGAV